MFLELCKINTETSENLVGTNEPKTILDNNYQMNDVVKELLDYFKRSERDLKNY